MDANRQWLSPARHLLSPNCDERPDVNDISLIIIHGISLPPNQYGGPHIDQLFTNSLNPDEHTYFAEIQALRVSSHLLIDRKGLLTQYVPFDKRAWHAGKSIYEGRENCNDFAIGIEFEGCDDEKYESCQYEIGATVVKLLLQSFPDLSRESIVGHCDVAPGRKTDPGEAFDWDYFRKLIV
ncbi:MAG: 1,6-anhydro-N-acetylmuramyl-L-alanine amidase AmpD [Gammaproteobacteria bacterium]|nr:1,6-anhydro-N-acetylmuramyl-L-alanine amidase AmpD [Gammaproteobacteria bacterium]